MHPAFSVIFLTTLIGVGQGLFLALFTTQLYAQFMLLPPQDTARFYSVGSLIAVLFLIAGLVASLFHLGRPERAWRSAARWRTSWLSREVIALPIALGLIGLYGGAQFLQLTQPLFTLPGGTQVDLTLIIGILATVMTFALFVCTGMIYAEIKFLQEWHSPLTVINYILLGGASGFTMAAALSAWMQVNLTSFYAGWAVALTLSAFIFRGLSLRRNKRLRHKSSLRTAIGIRHTQIAQKAQGAMGGSFNTREFFHGKTATFVSNLKASFIILTFLIPLMLLGLSFKSPIYALPLAAFVIQYLGLLAERWYFFAEANHPQNIYYQSIA